jgi:hypothetical protein
MVVVVGTVLVTVTAKLGLLVAVQVWNTAVTT